MSYQVIGYPLCPYVQRVLIALNYKKVDYSLEWLNPHETLPEWFKKWSPIGRVPVMKIPSGEILFESLPMVEFLEEEFPNPSFYIKGKANKALERAWTGIAGELYGPQYMMMISKTEEEMRKHLGELENILFILESHKNSEAHYYMHNGCSLVDLVLAPMFARFKVVQKQCGLDVLQKYTRLNSLSRQLLQQPMVKQTMENNWEEKFIENMKQHCSFIFP